MTPSAPEYCTIELTQNQIAIVSSWAIPLLLGVSWHARWATNTRTFYAVGSFKDEHGKFFCIPMHQLIMSGHTKGSFVDHINGDTLDNRDENLRWATRSQNGANRKKRIDSKSRFKGVSWITANKKWCAQLRHNGKLYRLGNFLLEEDAYRAYSLKAKEVFGEYWRPG